MPRRLRDRRPATLPSSPPDPLARLAPEERAAVYEARAQAPAESDLVAVELEPLPRVDPEAEDAAPAEPEWQPVWVPIDLELIFDWA